MRFHVGKLYNRRRDLHGRFGGQQQGGMSTPKAHPVIFLFTGEGGAEHGYRDEFKPDGTFHYTGEGQRGDMEFVRANRALRDHHADGKSVHVFEAVGAGQVRYIGEGSYLGHHREARPDTDGEWRQAIVFVLQLESTPASTPTTCEPKAGYMAKEQVPRSLEALRRAALARTDSNATPTQQRRNIRARSEAVRAYVLRRAGGTCEGCGVAAPFMTTKGEPYLEPHHTTRLADGGPDHPAHVIALCPTCHRRVHYGHDGKDYNEALAERLSRIERTL